MKKIRIYLIAIFSLIYATSCVDLDITPTTIITGEAVYNEAGIKAYMAGMYNNLPMEDFKYDAGGGNNGYFNHLNIGTLWASTGEMVNHNNAGFTRHGKGYWGAGFRIIRQANTLIQDLPNYPNLATWSSEWIAEAKFIRAFVYFNMARRYGGLPKILEPQYLDPNDDTKLQVARVSHADTYDFILQDLDEAIADLPARSDVGRANLYVAAAFKSRVALHAATTAKYGSVKFADWEVDGVLLQGIPASRANDYFKQAWDAARILEGEYSLYRGNADKMENYVEIWERPEANNENILLRKYNFTDWVHSYDAVFAPRRMTTNYGSRFSPTLDWVELFDGLPLDENGHFSAFDNDGNYIVYDDVQQLWNGVEPRLRANLLLPGNTYRGVKLDLRGGLIRKDIDPETAQIKKFSFDDGENGNGYRDSWQLSGNYTETPFGDAENAFIRWTSTEAQIQGPANLVNVGDENNPVMVYLNGRDGPRMSWAGGSNTATGFYGRKHLNLVMAPPDIHMSTQPWIEMRYAEVLLNRAEAAIELAQGGEATYGGVNMLQDAFECINDIRDRAGATLLANVAELSDDEARINYFPTRPNIGPATGPTGQGGFVRAPNRALQILRVERYKELAFESRIYWDLMRWFSFDEQIFQYRRRGLYSFMFIDGAIADADGIPDGKLIYDAKAAEDLSGRLSFGGMNEYYETIPSGELQNNPLLQRNRNQ